MLCVCVWWNCVDQVGGMTLSHVTILKKPLAFLTSSWQSLSSFLRTFQLDRPPPPKTTASTKTKMPTPNPTLHQQEVQERKSQVWKPQDAEKSKSIIISYKSEGLQRNCLNTNKLKDTLTLIVVWLVAKLAPNFKIELQSLDSTVPKGKHSPPYLSVHPKRTLNTCASDGGPYFSHSTLQWNHW